MLPKSPVKKSKHKIFSSSALWWNPSCTEVIKKRSKLFKTFCLIFSNIKTVVQSPIAF